MIILIVFVFILRVFFVKVNYPKEKMNGSIGTDEGGSRNLQLPQKEI